MSDSDKRDFFDKEALGWNKRYHQKGLEEIRNLINRFDIRSDDFILDVGTGNGILLPFLLEKVEYKSRIVALDFSWNMIREASRLVPTRGLGFVNASAEWLPTKSEIFDCITCLATFAHICEKEKALNEIGRVLKKGGRFYIAHLLGKGELAEHHKSAGGAVEHDVLPPDAEMETMMMRAGLREIRIIDQSHLYLASAIK
jgi:ubiquinone/menaquinone biosynthesis C-methylase UbiE